MTAARVCCFLCFTPSLLWVVFATELRWAPVEGGSQRSAHQQEPEAYRLFITAAAKFREGAQQAKHRQQSDESDRCNDPLHYRPPFFSNL